MSLLDSLNPITGIVKTVTDIASKFITSPEDKLKFEQQVNNAEVLLIQEHNKDTDSARRREVEMAKSGNKDNTLKILAISKTFLCYLFTGAFIYMMCKLNMPKDVVAIMGGVIGYMWSDSNTVTGYFFGSSSGSKSKDALLSKEIK